jgi:hypothetical protein
MQVELLSKSDNSDNSSESEYIIHVADSENHDPKTCRECQNENSSCNNTLFCVSMIISFVFLMTLSYYNLRI